MDSKEVKDALRALPIVVLYGGLFLGFLWGLTKVLGL